MATRRVKTWERKEESRDNSNTTLSVDRISKLPDRVICHILSFVPTVYAVRMSLLSRRWRRVWYSVPALRFSDSDGFHCHEWFDMFVEHCLMHRSVTSRYISDSEVASFKLEITYNSEVDRPEVNRWSKSPIIRNNVRELEICALLDRKSRLIRSNCRPSVALNGRSLSVVKLTGVKLDGSCTMNLPSLKSLCLDDVTFDNNVDDGLRDLMIGCPSLEKFVLKVCLASCFSESKISSSSLKFMEIDTGIKTVDIEALNLQSLVLHSYGCSQKCFSSCTAIRDLSLFGLRSANRKNIEDQISKLTCLETLTLAIFVALDRINIVNPTLKCFYLTKYSGDELKVTTETPNLVSFKYEGDLGFSITMATPNPQLSGSFSFWCPYSKKYDTDYWYAKLITFFANINCLWDSLSLCSNQDEAFIIPEQMRKTCRPPWPNLKHLKVRVRFILMKSELRKSLEWLSPSLETLSVEVLRGKRVQIVAI